MDSLRGHFGGLGGYDAGPDHDDDVGRELPPAAIGQDERRMQVRAYNFWAAMLGDRRFPSIEDLDPENLPDFGPQSVLLDFTGGIDDPAVRFLGRKLAEECGTEGPIRALSDVPSRSLLSRITDHYMQILANEAPIGFEAEFVNQRDRTILYRGILLPFSSDDDTIDFIYGVINWKEMADQQTTDALLLEIDKALDVRPNSLSGGPQAAEPLAVWADGPVDDAGVLDLGAMPLELTAAEAIDWPAPAYGAIAAPLDETTMVLADWLASARELAEAARASEDRSHQALYAAIGRAWDFALAAAAAPEDFRELLADAGLTAQDRAPMTPVVKLVFGAGYDKTRLAEYATALARAQRLELPRGALAAHLAEAPGGLKGIVAEERRLRREQSGRQPRARTAPREALARKLRRLDARPLAEVSQSGSEFALLVARRLASGEVVVLGEVSDDLPLFERAARKLVG